MAHSDVEGTIPCHFEFSVDRKKKLEPVLERKRAEESISAM